MKFKKLILPVVCLLFASAAFSQPANPFIDPDDYDYSESCTSIMAGRKATTDGSVITAHTCDANYRTWVTFEKRKKYSPGDTEPVFWGTLHNEEPDDMRNVKIKGKIPAPTETYAYLNVAYPCLNEKQLGIGETTVTGKKELENPEGLFLIEELERIVLQRCSNARDAIRLIGELTAEYGYGDSGECITIADKKEVWQLEIFGSGPGKPAAIWVAARIPDENIGISANIPRISVVDFNNPDLFMYSKDIRERTKKLGFWDGNEPFKFWKIVSDSKPYSIREFFVFNTLAPSLKLNMDMEELPFSVKPDKRVNVREILALYRQTYEGTEYDMTKNLVAEISRRDKDNKEYKEKVKPVSNFMTNDMRTLLNQIKPGITDRYRTIAVIQCSYSHIIQLRDWLPDEVGGVAYLAFDNPAQSPRIPIYSGTISLPASFAICGQHRYRNDAAIWSFRETNRIATINWDKTRKLLEPQIMSFENKMFGDAPSIEARVVKLVKEGKNEEAKEYLTGYTADFASAAMRRWQELKSELWSIFSRSM
jgi:dipeptidase